MNKLKYFLLHVLIWGCSCRGDSQKDINWKEEGMKTIGTICKLEYGRGSSNTICYEVDGKRYELRCSFKLYGITVGEKYTITYLPEDLNNATVLDWEPIFTSWDNHEESEGSVDKILHFKFWGQGSRYGVRYTYIANGKEYQREQHLPPDYNKADSIIKEDQKYLVWYDASNPQRAVMYLNKPK